MAVTLVDICNGLADRMKATPGVQSAYGVPPNQLGPLPCGVVFSDPEQISDVLTANLTIVNHRLLCRLHVAVANNIEVEFGQAMGYIEPFMQAVMADDHLGLGKDFYGAVITGYRNGITANYGDTAYVVTEWLVTAKAKPTELMR